MSLARVTFIVLVLMGTYFFIGFSIKEYEIKHNERYEVCGIVLEKYQVLVKTRSSHYEDWIKIKGTDNKIYDFFIHRKIINQVSTQKINKDSKVCFKFVNLSYDFGYWFMGTKKIDKRLLYIEKKY